MAIQRMTELQTILKGIEQVARAEILRDFRTDSCIASTRVIMRVLDHFGYDAQPLSVRVMIFNPTYVKHIEEKTIVPNTDMNYRRWLQESGAWSVGLGFAVPGEPVAYVGHLVAAVPSAHLFIDASLDQAERPQRDILLPSVLISPMTQQFLTTIGEKIEFESSHGVELIYERIDNPTFRKSPDWTERDRTKRAVKRIIRHVERIAS